MPSMQLQEAERYHAGLKDGSSLREHLKNTGQTDLLAELDGVDPVGARDEINDQDKTEGARPTDELAGAAFAEEKPASWTGIGFGDNAGVSRGGGPYTNPGFINLGADVRNQRYREQQQARNNESVGGSGMDKSTLNLLTDSGVGDVLGSALYGFIDSATVGSLGMISTWLGAKTGDEKYDFWNTAYKSWGEADTSWGRSAEMVGGLAGFLVPTGVGALARGVGLAAKVGLKAGAKGARAVALATKSAKIIAGTEKAIKVGKVGVEVATTVGRAGNQVLDKGAAWTFGLPGKAYKHVVSARGAKIISGQVLKVPAVAKAVGKTEKLLAKTGANKSLHGARLAVGNGTRNILSKLGIKTVATSSTEHVIVSAVEKATAQAFESSSKNITKLLARGAAEDAEKVATSTFVDSMRNQLKQAMAKQLKDPATKAQTLKFIDSQVLIAGREFSKIAGSTIASGAHAGVSGAVARFGKKGLLLEYPADALIRGSLAFGLHDAVERMNTAFRGQGWVMQQEGYDDATYFEGGWAATKEAMLDPHDSIFKTMTHGAMFHSLLGAKYVAPHTKWGKKLFQTSGEGIINNGWKALGFLKPGAKVEAGLDTELLQMAEAGMFKKMANALGLKNGQKLAAVFKDAASADKTMTRPLFNRIMKIVKDPDKLTPKELAVVISAYRSQQRAFDAAGLADDAGMLLGRAQERGSALSSEGLQRLFKLGKKSKSAMTADEKVLFENASSALRAEREQIWKMYKDEARGTFVSDVAKSFLGGTPVAMATGGWSMIKDGDTSLENVTGVMSHFGLAMMSASHSSYRGRAEMNAWKADSVKNPTLMEVPGWTDAMLERARYKRMARMSGIPVNDAKGLAFVGETTNTFLYRPEAIGSIKEMAEDVMKRMDASTDQMPNVVGTFEKLPQGQEAEFVTPGEVEVARTFLRIAYRNGTDMSKQLLTGDKTNWYKEFEKLDQGRQNVLLGKVANSLRASMAESGVAAPGEPITQSTIYSGAAAGVRKKNSAISGAVNEAAVDLVRLQESLGGDRLLSVIEFEGAEHSVVNDKLRRFVEMAKLARGPAENARYDMATHKIKVNKISVGEGGKHLQEVEAILDRFGKKLTEIGIHEEIGLQSDSLYQAYGESLLAAGRSSRIELHQMGFIVPGQEGGTKTSAPHMVERESLNNALSNIMLVDAGGTKSVKQIDFGALAREGKLSPMKIEQIKGLWNDLVYGQGLHVISKNLVDVNADWRVTSEAQLKGLWSGDTEFTYDGKHIGRDGPQRFKHSGGIMGLLADARIQLSDAKFNKQALKEMISLKSGNITNADVEYLSAATEDGFIANTEHGPRAVKITAVVDAQTGQVKGGRRDTVELAESVRNMLRGDGGPGDPIVAVLAADIATIENGGLSPIASKNLAKYVEIRYEALMNAYEQRVESLIEKGILTGWATNTGKVDGAPTSFVEHAEGPMGQRLYDTLQADLFTQMVAKRSPGKMGEYEMLEEDFWAKTQDLAKKIKGGRQDKFSKSQNVRMDAFYNKLAALMKANNGWAMGQLQEMFSGVDVLKFNLEKGKHVLDVSFVEDPATLDKVLNRFEILNRGYMVTTQTSMHEEMVRAGKRREEIEERIGVVRDESHNARTSNQLLEDLEFTGHLKDVVTADLSDYGADLRAKPQSNYEDYLSGVKKILKRHTVDTASDKQFKEFQETYIDQLEFHEANALMNTAEMVDTVTYSHRYDSGNNQLNNIALDVGNTPSDNLAKLRQGGDADNILRHESTWTGSTKATKKAAMHEVSEALGVPIVQVDPYSTIMGKHYFTAMTPKERATLVEDLLYGVHEGGKRRPVRPIQRKEGAAGQANIERLNSGDAPILTINMPGEKLWGVTMPSTSAEARILAQKLGETSGRLGARGRSTSIDNSVRLLDNIINYMNSESYTTAGLLEKITQRSRDGGFENINEFSNAIMLAGYERLIGADAVLALRGEKGPKMLKRIKQMLGGSSARMDSERFAMSLEKARTFKKNNKNEDGFGLDKDNKVFLRTLEVSEVDLGDAHSGVAQLDGALYLTGEAFDAMALTFGHNPQNLNYDAIKGHTYIRPEEGRQVFLDKPAIFRATPEMEALMKNLGVSVIRPSSTAKVGGIGGVQIDGRNWTEAVNHFKTNSTEFSGSRAAIEEHVQPTYPNDFRVQMVAKASHLEATKSGQSTYAMREKAVNEYLSDMPTEAVASLFEHVLSQTGLDGMAAAREFITKMQHDSPRTTNGQWVGLERYLGANTTALLIDRNRNRRRETDYSTNPLASPTSVYGSQVVKRLSSMLNDMIFKTKTNQGSVSVIRPDENNVLDPGESLAGEHLRRVEQSLDRSFMGVKRTVRWDGTPFTPGHAELRQKELMYSDAKENNWYNSSIETAGPGQVTSNARKSGWINMGVTGRGDKGFLYNILGEWHGGGGNKATGDGGKSPLLNLFNKNTPSFNSLESVKGAAKIVNDYAVDLITAPYLTPPAREAMRKSARESILEKMTSKSAMEASRVDAALTQVEAATGKVEAYSSGKSGMVSLGNLHDFQGSLFGSSRDHSVGYEYNKRFRRLEANGTGAEMNNYDGMAPVTTGILGLSQRSPSSSPNDQLPVNLLGFHSGSTAILGRLDANDIAEADYDIDKFSFYFGEGEAVVGDALRLRNYLGAKGDLHSKVTASDFDFLPKGSHSDPKKNDVLRYDQDQAKGKRMIGQLITAKNVVQHLQENEVALGYTSSDGTQVRIRTKGRVNDVMADTQNGGAESVKNIARLIQQATDTAGGFLPAELARIENPTTEVFNEILVKEIWKDGKIIDTVPLDPIKDMEAMMPIRQMLGKLLSTSKDAYGEGGESESKPFAKRFEEAGEYDAVWGGDSARASANIGKMTISQLKRFGDGNLTPEEIASIKVTVNKRTNHADKIVEGILKSGRAMDNARNISGTAREGRKILSVMLSGDGPGDLAKLEVVRNTARLKSEIKNIEKGNLPKDMKSWEVARRLEQIENMESTEVPKLKRGTPEAWEAQQSTIDAYSLLLLGTHTPDLAPGNVRETRRERVKAIHGDIIASGKQNWGENAGKDTATQSERIGGTESEQATAALVGQHMSLFGGEKMENFDIAAAELLMPRELGAYKLEGQNHFKYGRIRQEILRPLQAMFPAETTAFLNKYSKYSAATADAWNGGSGGIKFLGDMRDAASVEGQVGALRIARSEARASGLQSGAKITDELVRGIINRNEAALKDRGLASIIEALDSLTTDPRRRLQMKFQTGRSTRINRPLTRLLPDGNLDGSFTQYSVGGKPQGLGSNPLYDSFFKTTREAVAREETADNRKFNEGKKDKLGNQVKTFKVDPEKLPPDLEHKARLSAEKALLRFLENMSSGVVNIEHGVEGKLQGADRSAGPNSSIKLELHNPEEC